MKDFMFLKDLDQAAKLKPTEIPIEIVTNETEYLVYKLMIDDIESKIGVPVHMVDKFDNYISENDITTVLENLSKFDTINIK